MLVYDFRETVGSAVVVGSPAGSFPGMQKINKRGAVRSIAHEAILVPQSFQQNCAEIKI